MFREEYIKANEQIKPDDDFLKRLKESVAKELSTEQSAAEGETIIHIGDYVDLKNAPDITNMEAVVTSSQQVVSWGKGIRWKNIAVVAACFVFICTLSFMASKMDILDDRKGLQAGVESVVYDDNELNADNVILQEQYQEMRKLFDTMNVVVYETQEFQVDETEKEYLQSLRESGEELTSTDRDELVGDILANQYNVKGSLEELDGVKYYLAEFEDRSCVCFAIDDNGSIYIVMISGIQSLAVR